MLLQLDKKKKKKYNVSIIMALSLADNTRIQAEKDMANDGQNVGNHHTMVTVKPEDVRAYLELVEKNTENALAEEIEEITRDRISPEG